MRLYYASEASFKFLLRAKIKQKQLVRIGVHAACLAHMKQRHKKIIQLYILQHKKKNQAISMIVIIKRIYGS